MKALAITFLFVSSLALRQLTIDQAQEASRKMHVSSYSYHEQFIGHKSYGAPLILTSDGGAAAFGDGDEGPMLIKYDKTGQVQWKRIFPPKGTEMELQSVVQDKDGSYFVFALIHDETKYRGGCERVAFINKSGAIVWDKYIGTFSPINNPIVSYIKGVARWTHIASRSHG